MPYSVKKVKGNKRENYTKRLHTLIAIHYNDTYDLTCHHQLHLIQSFTEGIKTDYSWADKDWNYLPQDEETRIQIKPMHFLLFPFSSHKTISDIAGRKNVVFSRRAGISAKTHYRRVCLLPTYFFESVCGRTSLPFRPVHKGNKKTTSV